MSARITISLPQSLVEAIDARAQAQGVSRSSVVREASSAYLSQAERASAEERRREGGKRLLEFLAEGSALPVADERPVLEILRELRGPLEESTGDPPSGERGSARERPPA